MEDLTEKARLIDQYGPVTRLDTGAMLRLLGLRGEVHPRDALAAKYVDMEAAHRFAAYNREWYGHRVHGPFETEVGPIAVVVYHDALRRHGCSPTDPSLPDEIGGLVRLVEHPDQDEEHRDDDEEYDRHEGDANGGR